ncbi:MAG TPA: acyltransferase family protein [Streptosporangiaceae bacterium]
MPKPTLAGQRYMPGLDGLRAIAVLAVIAFHEQLGWAQGGLLGVGVFFTLSGYLITSLLLGQWSKSGGMKLGDFWLRRARRLLPALFVMLAVVTAWVTIIDRARLSSLRGAVGAAATYWSNWYLIAKNQSYFARFAPPAPLDHLWSLAVEEQFYLLWPGILLLGLLALRRISRGGSFAWLALPAILLAALSAAEMTVLYRPGFDPTRVYEGTDTRAFGLLIGAALAMAWPVRRAAEPPRRVRHALDVTGIAGLIVIFIMFWKVGQYSPFAYRGGLILLSVATAAVVAIAACPSSVVGMALAWRPLRWIGVRSYGIYLWHFPVIVLTSPANGREDLPRAVLQVAAAIGLAALSWRFVEEPIRQGALSRLFARLRSSGWRARPAGLGGVAAVVGGTGVLVVACGGLAGAFPASGTPSRTSALASGSGLSQSSQSVNVAPPAPATSQQATPGHQPLRTSCTAVVHIGDSTSDGLVSRDYLPNPRQRIVARYEDVGVHLVRTDVVGARSVVETLPGTVNGYDAAINLDRHGYKGCWVIALGTDDSADVAVGSEVSLKTRIQKMMSAARGQPVMWVNVKSLLATGPYAESHMRQWNDALLAACSRYPNMRIFDWASLAKRSWFIADGIHYTSLGYEHRAKDIADALARAFPAGSLSTSCVVS